MPITPKQEAFARAIVAGSNQTEAYRKAYKVRPTTKPESVNVSASKLMSDPNVTQRIASLTGQAAKKAQITLESHLEDLQRLRNMAAKSNQWSAAISAEIARGKAAGVHVEKSEQLVTMRKLEPIADDEFLG